MDNYSKLYWLTRLDYLQGFFVAASIVIGLLIIAHYVVFAASEGDTVVFKSKYTRALLFPAISITILIACLIPTKNEMLLIYAGGKTMDFVEKDSSLSKIPEQSTAIISNFLDKQLKEMKSKDK